MASRAFVQGTVYDVSGGKAMVQGTVREIDKGRTMVQGTAYDVPFAQPGVILLKFTEGPPPVKYVLEVNGEVLAEGTTSVANTFNVNPGDSVKYEQGSAFPQFPTKIYFNGELVASGGGGTAAPSYSWTAEAGKSYKISSVVTGPPFTVNITDTYIP